MGQRSLERLFPGLTEDSMTQATLSASQSGIGFKRARDIAAPAHLGALIASKPRIQGMTRDAVLAGLLPEQLLETRLSEAIETATSTSLSALDNDEQATARLFIQKAAQAADESWQQTVSGQQGPEVANPTIASVKHPSSASQEEDSDGMDFSAPRKSRFSGPQLQAQLSRLTDRTRLRRLKGSSRRVPGSKSPRIDDLCHAQVSRRWLFHLDACAGSVLTPHDYVTNVQKRLGNRLWRVMGSVGAAAPSWTLSWSMQKPAAPLTPPRTLRVFSRRSLRHETCGPGITTECRLIFLPPLLSQDAPRPWTRAWPPPLHRQLAEMRSRRHLIVS